MTQSASHRVWSVAEARENLPEILRLAEEDGPQRIGDTKILGIIPKLPNCHILVSAPEPLNVVSYESSFSQSTKFNAPFR